MVRTKQTQFEIDCGCGRSQRNCVLCSWSSFLYQPQWRQPVLKGIVGIGWIDVQLPIARQLLSITANTIFNDNLLFSGKSWNIGIACLCCWNMRSVEGWPWYSWRILILSETQWPRLGWSHNSRIWANELAGLKWIRQWVSFVIRVQCCSTPTYVSQRSGLSCVGWNRWLLSLNGVRLIHIHHISFIRPWTYLAYSHRRLIMSLELSGRKGG
jgi:hypothetical protein